MLRTLFLCRKCASALGGGGLSKVTNGGGLLKVVRKSLATVHIGDEQCPERRIKGYKTQNIHLQHGQVRDYLQKWEAENPAPVTVFTRDALTPAEVENAPIPPYVIDTLALDDPDFRDPYSCSEGDDSFDLRPETTGLKPGDLIEVAGATRSFNLSIIAVCLGTFNGYDHYYTDTGKWFVSQGVRTTFVAPKYIDDPGLIRPLLDSLPTRVSDERILNILQDLKFAPSRAAGAVLLKRLHKFSGEVAHIQQTHLAALMAASKTLGQDEKMISVAEAAEALLPPTLKRGGKFKPEALYAVHLSLAHDELGFRPFTHGDVALFQVAKESDVARVKRIESLVRDYGEKARRAGRTGPSNMLNHPLGKFIAKARGAIDGSRKQRVWTPHGMLGPWDTEGAQMCWKVDEGGVDLDVIEFLHFWAATNWFAKGSRWNSIGSMILRALDRYRDAEHLDCRVAWTMLQEIGWIKPWETQTVHSMRLPGMAVSRAGNREPCMRLEESLRDDVAEGARLPCHATVYCIDGEGADDIDDGVSLETTETVGEYWIHAHIADPASRIKPDSALAERASLMTQTCYLSGHRQDMLHAPGIRDMFSLAPGRPCLTLSAKVNDKGVLLDHKIAPATVQDVKHMTYDELAAVCGRDDSLCSTFPIGASFAVGEPRSCPVREPSRTFAKAAELSSRDTENLQTLARLAKAVQDIRLAKGAQPLYWPNASVRVLFGSTKSELTDEGFLRCTGDPYIAISVDDSSAGTTLVASVMRLANEVAARWCHEHGVPIPYRSTPRATENAAALAKLTQSVIYPQLRAGQRPTDADMRILRALLGGFQLSTVPGINYDMGVDMYTKATSPLRRYSDLLVHWQMHALLASQRAPNTQPDYPFSRHVLDKQVIPRLKALGAHARLMGNVDGPHEWILQALVRAWKFGQGDTPLPPTFQFVVASPPKPGLRWVKGRIDWFDRPAFMKPAGFEAIDGVMADVKAGEVFEVELVDVDVHGKMIEVRALSRVA